MIKKTKKRSTQETDSLYFLKIVLFLVLGSLWVKFESPLVIGGLLINGLPVGLVLGVLFASHDHFQVDRKIEYALLILTAVVTYFLPAGVVI